MVRTCERISKSSTSDKEDHREQWYEHVKRRDEGHVLRRMVDDMESVGLKEEDVLDRTKWKKTPEDGKSLRRRRRII